MEISQTQNKALSLHKAWFKHRGWKAFPYQEEALLAYQSGKDGLINAPTGSGKTFSLWLPILIDWIVKNGNVRPKPRRLKVLWITPVRALANDLQLAMQKAAQELGLDWEVGIRTGDTDIKTRTKQKTVPPECLITTPESLHLMLSNKGYQELFGSLEAIVIDEWHELLGTKRGVQVELALAVMRTLSPSLRIWGISATIGNMADAVEVLLGSNYKAENTSIVRSEIEKKIVIKSVLPDEVEDFPWGGHLGIKLLHKILPILQEGKTTLVFTNTRSQCEIWYSYILEAMPELAGEMALHHGSLSGEVRTWVEDNLRSGGLKVVVCTSSLDLGVDFRPVERIIQIGGPKGVARFLQRAGRSGHRPDAESVIYFVPTHSLELIEAAALREAIKQNAIEPRRPVIRAFDVLIQFLVTMAISEGFKADEMQALISNTFAYNSLNQTEWENILGFITTGGSSLKEYKEHYRVTREEDFYFVKSKRIAMRHRVNIGTITSDVSIAVKFLSGGYIGNIEEYFVSKLKPGTVFSFGGKNLIFVQLKDMTCFVRKGDKRNVNIPSWQGGRMPLSSMLSSMIREKLNQYLDGTANDVELEAIKPMLDRQQRMSLLPHKNELLIEQIKTKEGYHLFFYPFEGRYVNEGIASLIALRLSQQESNTFSIGLSDYGFELLSDDPVNIADFLEEDIFHTNNLLQEIQEAMNAVQLASRKFRDIAQISGLTFPGMPGKELKARHLQASSTLFFNMFSQYEPNHLLLRQAYDEVLYDQMDEPRLRAALHNIAQQKIVVTYPDRPTPFSFPIMVERIRSKYSNETLEERVQKMITQIEGKK
jgi:ATP-dependent Lhr-like helicase